jgi:hypothetical protein
MDISAILRRLAGNRMQFVWLKRRSYCGVHGTLAANLNRFLTSRLLG